MQLLELMSIAINKRLMIIFMVRVMTVNGPRAEPTPICDVDRAAELEMPSADGSGV